MTWLQFLCIVVALRSAEGYFSITTNIEDGAENNITIINYDIKLMYDIDNLSKFNYYGLTHINLKVISSTKVIHLHVGNYCVAKEKITVSQNNLTINKLMVPKCIHKEDNDTTILSVKTVKIFKRKLTLALSEELEVNMKYTLSIPIYGNLKENSSNVFLGSYINGTTYEKEYYIVSEFEKSCRLGFPCIEDPKLKPTYTVSIGHHKDYNALSNMPLSRTSNENELASVWAWSVIESSFGKNRTEYVWEHFEETIPMHFYSVAFTVSKYKAVTTPSNITMWVRPDIVNDNKVTDAADKALKIIRYIRGYFSLPYILPKLDLIVIPDVRSSDLVEMIGNWGLIKLRESQLNALNHITYVLSQKMIYQWLGHQIYPKSTDEVLLNLGCSLFIGDLITGKILKQTNIDLIFVPIIKKVLNADTSEDSEPYELSKELLVDKAAIIYRMIFKSLGEEVFRETIYKYVKNCSSYGNLERDIWMHMDEVGAYFKTLPSNVTLGPIIETWTKQPGYPLLTVQRDYENKGVNITQKRFLATAIGENYNDQGNSSWWMPIQIMVDQQPEKPVLWLAKNEGTNEPRPFEHKADKDQWILINPDIMGLCRINYDARNWELLIQTLLDKENYKNIPVMSRVQLLTDAFALASTGNLNYSTALDLVSYLKHEEDPQPRTVGLEELINAEKQLRSTPDYEKYQNLAQQLLGETYSKLGGLVKNESKDNSEIELEKNAVKWACQMRYPECEETAIKMFKTLMNKDDPDNDNNIPVHLRGTVYCTAVARGSIPHWNFALERARNDREGGGPDALAALTCNPEPWLMIKAIDKAVNEKFENVDDSMNILVKSALRSPMSYCVVRNYIYDWIVENFSRQFERIYFIEQLLQTSTTEYEVKEFVDWYSNTKSNFDFGADQVIIENAIEKATSRFESFNNVTEPIGE